MSLRPLLRWWMAVLVAAIVSCWAVFFHVPGGMRSGRQFDPDRLADLEVEMWQAYYQKRKVELFRLLVVMLREQFHYSWSQATAAAFHLANAAAAFGDARDRYDRVLPDLQEGYAIAREWTGASFDPALVARDELAWWVARRDPSESDPDHVGALIARLYSDFYEVPVQSVLEAGVLRARAADLRDRGGGGADWITIGARLHESYRSLRQAVDAKQACTAGPGC